MNVTQNKIWEVENPLATKVSSVCYCVLFLRLYGIIIIIINEPEFLYFKNKRIKLRVSEYEIAVNLYIQELANWMSAYEYFVTESPLKIACFKRIFPIIIL